jgi:hypothetical protein
LKYSRISAARLGDRVTVRSEDSVFEAVVTIPAPATYCAVLETLTSARPSI